MTLPATGIWEVESTGSDTHGGLFDPGVTSPGTDYTYGAGQASFSYSDLASANGTGSSPVVTSVGRPFVAADVGNTIQISSGTNWTAGFYSIRSVSSGAATLDRACGTAASLSSGVGVLGGALATPAKAFTACVGEETIYLKGPTYTTPVQLIVPTGNTSSGAPCCIVGYTTTRGDGGQATIQYTGAGLASAGVLQNSGTTYCSLFNVIVDVNSKTSTRAINTSGAWNASLDQITIKNFTDYGIVWSSGAIHARRVLALNGTPANSTTAAMYDAVGGSWQECAVVSCSCSGFKNVFGTLGSYDRCVAANLTSGGHGFYTSNLLAISIKNCTVYNVGGDAVHLGGGNSINDGQIHNCIFAANLNGINNPNAQPAVVNADYNAFWSNTSNNYVRWPAGAHDILLTGNPFVNPSGSVATLADVWTNFALNNTAGAGASCRAAAYPSYLDLGAVQHQDAGGGGGGLLVARGYSGYTG